jgi:hypothetical protein
LKLIDILANDQRIIVLSDPELLYTWNKGLSIQCWKRKEDWCQECGREDAYEETAIQTLMECPKGYEEARWAAMMWRQNSNEKDH